MPHRTVRRSQHPRRAHLIDIRRQQKGRQQKLHRQKRGKRQHGGTKGKQCRRQLLRQRASRSAGDRQQGGGRQQRHRAERYRGRPVQQSKPEHGAVAPRSKEKAERAQRGPLPAMQAQPIPLDAVAKRQKHHPAQQSRRSGGEQHGGMASERCERPARAVLRRQKPQQQPLTQPAGGIGRPSHQLHRHRHTPFFHYHRQYGPFLPLVIHGVSRLTPQGDRLWIRATRRCAAPLSKRIFAK